jgi:hypothetical protein
MAQTHSIRFVLCTVLIAFVTFAVVNADWLVVYRDENFYKLNPETGALTSFQRNNSLSMVDYRTNTLDVNHKRFYWTNEAGGRWLGFNTYIAGHDFVTNKNLVSPGYNISKVKLSHLFYDNKEDILYTLHRNSHEVSVVDIDVENGRLALGKSIGKLHADGYELSLKIHQYDYRYGVLYVDALTSSEYTSVLLGFDLNTGKVLNTLKTPEVGYSEIIHTYLDYDRDLLVVFDLDSFYNTTLVTYTINLKTGEISVPYTAWDMKIENLETRDPLTGFDITTGKGVLIFTVLRPMYQCRAIYFDIYNKERLSDSTIPFDDVKAIVSTPFSL